jgi:dipeptidase E
MMAQQIIALGGGGFSQEPDNPRLDTYVLRLARRRRPRICFLPTASGDAADYIARFYAAFPSHRCEPSHLLLFSRRVDDLRDYLRRQDIVYVGGGNTANMLAIWRVHGLDQVLREVAASGIILGGVSAGALCWFEGGITDSFGTRVQPLRDGLGLVTGLFCPHFDSEPSRRAAYHQLVAATGQGGFAAEDGVALHLIDGRLARVVASRPAARAYRVEVVDGAVVERVLEPRLLAVDASEGIEPAVRTKGRSGRQLTE